MSATAIKLDCDATRLVLGIMDIDKTDKFTAEEQAAMSHYSGCWKCGNQGIAVLTGKSLSCQEAIEQWAKNRDHILQSPRDCSNVRDLLASEHVYGRTTCDLMHEGTRFEELLNMHYSHACQEKSCRAVADYWHRAPLCSHYDGDRETAMFIPLLLLVFKRASWPLDELLEIQSKMFSRLTDYLLLRSNISRAQEEMTLNIQALQVLSSPNWEVQLQKLINGERLFGHRV